MSVGVDCLKKATATPSSASTHPVARTAMGALPPLYVPYTCIFHVYCFNQQLISTYMHRIWKATGLTLEHQLGSIRPNRKFRRLSRFCSQIFLAVFL